MPLYSGKDKYFFHYIWENIHKIEENMAIFGLGMPPVTHITCTCSNTDKICCWTTFFKIHPNFQKTQQRSHFMAVNLLIRKCTDDFATTEVNCSVSDHGC